MPPNPAAAPRFTPDPGPAPSERPPAMPAAPATGQYPVTAPPPATNGTRPPQAPPSPATPLTTLTTPAAPASRGAAALVQVPYLIVLACTLGGVLWAWSGAHAVGNGAGVAGGALLVAAVARLALPQSAVGLLANRRRWVDVLALGLLGAGLLVIALVLPPT